MKKSVTANYIYMVIFQVLSLITPIITSPYLARVLGVSGTGIYSYTYSILNWFIIFASLGTSIYGAKEISKVRDDREKLSQTFFEIFSFQCFVNLLMLLLYYIVFSVINTDYRIFFYIQGINVFANLFNVTWLFTGIEDFRKIAFRSSLFRIITVILVLLIVKGSNSLYIYCVLMGVMNLLSNLYIFLCLKKHVLFNKKYITKQGIIKHIKPNIILFIPQIAISIYAVLDQSMIGFITGSTDEVAYYVKGEQFVKMFLYVVTTIGTVMMPRIANLFYNKDYEKVKEYVNKSLNIVLYLSIPMCFGIAAVAQFFVSWFLTPDFAPSAIVMMILSPIIVLISVNNVIGGQYLLPTEDIKHYTTSVTIGAIVNLISNSFLIYYLGCYGAAIGTVLAETSVLIYQLIIIKNDKIIEISIKKTLLYLTSSIIMFIIVYFIGNYFGIRILSTLIQIIAGLIIYITLMFIFKDDTQKFIINKALSLLKLKKNN